MHKSDGVTMIEMLATLAILAILGTMAAPAFSNLLHDSARTAAVNDLFHALFLARSESIKRGTVVSVCRSPDGLTCANRSAEWKEGWIVFANQDADDPPVRDADESVLAVYQGWDRGHIASNRIAYSFRPFQQAVVNGTIVFCDPRGSEHARAIIISHTGRPRIAKRDSSNRPLRCPESGP